MTSNTRTAAEGGDRPLTQEDVGKLKAGRSVLRTSDGLGVFERRDHAGRCIVQALDKRWLWDFLARDCSYIGERDEDGWIHAPEGGWLENPVPGMRVDAKIAGGYWPNRPSANVDWSGLIAFRPIDRPVRETEAHRISDAEIAANRSYSSNNLAAPQPPVPVVIDRPEREAEASEKVCPTCGNEELTGAGYLTCECPAPANPQPLGGECEPVAWIIDWRNKPSDRCKSPGGGSHIIRNQYAAVEGEVATLKGLSWVESVTVTPLVPAKAITDLEERLSVMRGALEPFAAFAENLDAEGWASNIHREGISVWFGPSDFRAAAQALSSIPGKSDV